MCQTRDHNIYIDKTKRLQLKIFCGDLLSDIDWEVKEDLFNPCRFSSDQTVAGSLTADRVCA